MDFKLTRWYIIVMRKDAERTRQKILDATQSLVLKYGYGGMSIDDVILKAGVTKGALFYHFKSKEDLARALVQGFADQDRVQLEEMFRQAESLSGDPVQHLLLVIGLYAEFLRNAPDPMDGCLYASFCYQSGLLDPTTLQPVKEMVLYWRERMAAKIREAVRSHKTRIDVDAEALADQVMVTFEGAYVLTKTLNDFQILIRQLEQLRAYIALIFGKESEIASTARTAALTHA